MKNLPAPKSSVPVEKRNSSYIRTSIMQCNPKCFSYEAQHSSLHGFARRGGESLEGIIISTSGGVNGEMSKDSLLSASVSE